MNATAESLDRAESLIASGQTREAVDLLQEVLRTDPDPEALARLVVLRHEAVSRLAPVPEPAPDPRHASPSAAAVDGIVPEIDAAELTPAVVEQAMGGVGCLLVRGLLGRTDTSALRAAVEQAISSRGARRIGDPYDVSYDPLTLPGPAGESLAAARMAIGRCVLAADSPAAFHLLLDVYGRAGIPQIMEAYLREPPALSATKTSLRRTPPADFFERLDPDQDYAGWHQDGAFLGQETRSLNLWVALTDCGRDAPGLDIVARRFDAVVPTGTASTWVTSPDVVAEVGRGAIVRPEFREGDAIFFDHLVLHQTGVDRSMTKTRYAIESWFFAPSSFPAGRVPLLV